MLIGMLQNSSLFNPIRRPEMVLRRRNIVLDQMVKYDYLAEREADSLKATPLDVDFKPENSHNEGLATYFRMHVQAWLKDWAANNPRANGQRYDIYKDGLKVYTTIDSKLQANAEEASTAHLKNLQRAFFRQSAQDTSATAPFIEVEKKQAEAIVEQAMRRSERWRVMRAEGKTDTVIKASFYVPTAMRVFNW